MKASEKVFVLLLLATAGGLVGTGLLSSRQFKVPSADETNAFLSDTPPQIRHRDSEAEVVRAYAAVLEAYGEPVGWDDRARRILANLWPRKFGPVSIDNKTHLSVLRDVPNLGCDAAPLIPHLMRLLSLLSRAPVPDASMIVACDEALRAIHCKSSIPYLIDELERGDFARRNAAAMLLVRFGPEASDAVPRLLTLVVQGVPNAPLALTAIRPEFPGLPELLIEVAEGAGSDVFLLDSCVTSLARLGERALAVAERLTFLLDMRFERLDYPSTLHSVFRADFSKVKVLIALGAMGAGASNVAMSKVEKLLSATDVAVSVAAAHSYLSMGGKCEVVSDAIKEGGYNCGFRHDFELNVSPGERGALSRLTFAGASERSDLAIPLTCEGAVVYLLTECEAKSIGWSGLGAASNDPVSELLYARAHFRRTRLVEPYLLALRNQLRHGSPGRSDVRLAAAYFLGELGGAAAPALEELEEHAGNRLCGAGIVFKESVQRIRIAQHE